MITHPMLAEAWDQVTPLRFPLLVTPKLDGVRTLIVRGQAVSRTFKPVPNRYIRKMFEDALPEGLDGEVMLPGQPFKIVSGAWRGQVHHPLIQFHAFDYAPDSLSTPYELRMKALANLALPPWVVKLLPLRVDNMEELEVLEIATLENGGEGLMLRSPDGPYKCGRASNREGYLLKLKRTEDSEARILEVMELQHNENVAETDAFGRTKRSGHRANLSPGGTMGKLRVQDIHSGIEFRIGTGFDSGDRAWFWEKQDEVIGKLVNYRFQRVGMDEKPRFPTYRGMRWDL